MLIFYLFAYFFTLYACLFPVGFAHAPSIINGGGAARHRNIYFLVYVFVALFNYHNIGFYRCERGRYYIIPTRALVIPITSWTAWRANARARHGDEGTTLSCFLLCACVYCITRSRGCVYAHLRLLFLLLSAARAIFFCNIYLFSIVSHKGNFYNTRNSFINDGVLLLLHWHNIV